MSSTLTSKAKFDATVADGVACVREWQRGSPAELDRWEKTYLTTAGANVMRDVAREIDDESIRRLVTKAVGSK